MNEQNIPEMKKRSFSDRVFSHPGVKTAVLAALAVICFVLFLIFDRSADHKRSLILTPIISLIAFLDTYFIFFIMGKNPSCSARTLSVIEVIFAFLLLLAAVLLCVYFAFDVAYRYTASIPAVFFAVCAIVLFHSRRDR